MFEFASGVPGYFASRKNSRPSSRRYAVTAYGSKGAIAFPLSDIPNETWILREPNWRGELRKIAVDGGLYAHFSRAASHPEVNTMLAGDLIAAIEQDRDPMCPAGDGLRTIEMVQAVYASSQAGVPVELPLRERRHPMTDVPPMPKD